MPDIKTLAQRPLAEYLVQNRNYRINETFADRDKRYSDVDALLRGEFGYRLPGDNVVIEPPMVMNLGLAFTQDVARLTTEQMPVYKSPVYGDDKKDEEDAFLREVIAETLWIENDGDLTIPQQAIDLAVCGAAYMVCWYDENSMYPCFTRVDPRHAYPNIQNGKLLDLLVIHVMPGEVADSMFPGKGILETSRNKDLSGSVEVWEYYKPGYACRWVAYLDKGGNTDANKLALLDEVEYEDDCMPAHMTQVASHDGVIRGMLDQIGNSLMAKNKIASLMTKYTEHKVFAPWEAKGILNKNETPGPNTVYEHDDQAPGETFMRRVDPAGSDPALFALMNLLDLDQRGAIGYPASRQGEVGQSIASAAFVESTQGQLSSIVKDVQAHLADLRGKVTETLFKLDLKYYGDVKKPLIRGVNGKNTYVPNRHIKDRTYIRVQYGAGAGLSRQNADTRILNLLGARLIPRSVARDNIEFLKDRSDIQDRIEQENAEDALQQLFWPDPTVPIDVKFKVKKLMADEGLNLADAFMAVQESLAQEAQAAQEQAQAAQQPGLAEAPIEPTAADDQALALEKGQVVQEPSDIDLPPAPLEQIFIG